MPNLSPQYQKVLEYIRKCPGLTSRQIENALNIPNHSDITSWLHGAWYIEKMPGLRSFRWKVKK